MRTQRGDGRIVMREFRFAEMRVDRLMADLVQPHLFARPGCGTK